MSRQPTKAEGFHRLEDDSSIEIFFADAQVAADLEVEPGWYWWACLPGCLPDSDKPTGPFNTSDNALADAKGEF